MAIAATEAVNNRQQALAQLKVTKWQSSELGKPGNTDWKKVEELSGSLVEHGIVIE
ncbi:hypothetical protein O9992_15470 [Vibrio lentus]|nr:hypothetical protein [Vibrio lentus]